jgi:hypothetical protein
MTRTFCLAWLTCPVILAQSTPQVTTQTPAVRVRKSAQQMTPGKSDGGYTPGQPAQTQTEAVTLAPDLVPLSFELATAPTKPISRLLCASLSPYDPHSAHKLRGPSRRASARRPPNKMQNCEANPTMHNPPDFKHLRNPGPSLGFVFSSGEPFQSPGRRRMK